MTLWAPTWWPHTASHKALCTCRTFVEKTIFPLWMVMAPVVDHRCMDLFQDYQSYSMIYVHSCTSNHTVFFTLLCSKVWNQEVESPYFPLLFQECRGSLNPFQFHMTFRISSVVQSCPTLCDPMDYSMPGFPIHHQLSELAQTHVHRVGDAIQPSHPLLSPSPPAFNYSEHQSLFQWVSSSHQVAKVLEFQLQHQSFQWIFRADFL